MIDFEVIRNDRTHEKMRMLIDLKNIFARQLPKMPKEYIVKLVFDRHHESMVILRVKDVLI
jgi:histone acetyltransferase